ncbi:MAG: hypothetical protein K6E50_12035 [Lachnospiraceae bacterium]|nr:hypothetical protein [Lachnospiraceae bacterium]
MYKKISALICFLFLWASLAFFCKALDKQVDMPSWDCFGKGIASGDGYYYSDSGNDSFRLYYLTRTGEIRKAYSGKGKGSAGIAKDGDTLYLLVEDSVRRDSGDLFRSYRVRSFTDDLVPAGVSAPLELHVDEQAFDLNIENGKVYITALSSDGKIAEIYQASTDVIRPVEEEGEEEIRTIRLDSTRLVESGTGRFFVDARCREGILYTRTDAEKPEGIFAPDEGMRKAVNGADAGFFASLRLVGDFPVIWGAGTALILVFMIMGFIALKNRRRLVYTGLLIEAVFIVLLLIFFGLFVRERSKLLTEAREDYASNAMDYLMDEMGDLEGWAANSGEEGWYESGVYRGAQGSLASFIRQAGNHSVFYDVLVLRLSDLEVVVSASGRNRESINDLYGENEVWAKLREGKETSGLLLGYGDRRSARGLLPEEEKSHYALVGIVENTVASDDPSADYALLIRNLLLVFMVGSAILFLILWLQAADLRRFESALQQVATDGKRKKKGNVAGHDLENMWNSLGEIDKRMDEMNYSRYRIYEAYYRFAPRNIDKILKKDSIADVKSGDSAVVSGTLAYVAGEQTLRADGRIAQLKRLLNFLGDHPEHEGIIVSDSDGFSVVELLFLEEARDTQSFATELLQSERERSEQIESTVLLYYGSYIYGVAGTEEQSLAFMLSVETRELARMTEWLRSLNMGVVITEDVKEREGRNFDLRFIGYVELSGTERQLKLYEVLDACPKAERQAKLECLETFGKGLELFYRRDYYIARNTFSDILKRNPQDEIVRWYLFESERLLDLSPGPNDSVGALHADEV